MQHPFRGTIIEESLEDPSILKELKILSTRVVMVTEKHKTPWLKQWTLHKVEIPEDKVGEYAKRLSKVLDKSHAGSWYCDFQNIELHYIVFRDKVFLAHKSNLDEYRPAMDYGKQLGIPEYQLDFV